MEQLEKLLSLETHDQDALETAFKQIKSQQIQNVDDVEKFASIHEQLYAVANNSTIRQSYSFASAHVLNQSNINDFTYFKIKMTNIRIQLKLHQQTDSDSSLDSNDRKISINQLSVYLHLVAQMHMKKDVMQALQETSLSVALGNVDALDQLIPLAIFCGRLSLLHVPTQYGVSNDFVLAILDKDKKCYEKLLDTFSTKLVEQNLYSFYCRGLLMIDLLNGKEPQQLLLPSELIDFEPLKGAGNDRIQWVLKKATDTNIITKAVNSIK